MTTLTQKQIKSKLTKQLNRLYSKEEQESLQFYPDKDEKYSYSWVIKHKREKVELVCNKKTGIVTTCTK